jgi:hypothetical protein
MSRSQSKELTPAIAPSPPASQSTLVEQSRAVAEVQAAIFVAQQFPRDLDRAEAEMRTSCGRLSLANRAFYAVPNRGTGPSVHLARELARIWGNLDYGVRELSRDDTGGTSEIQAFAWDQQTNVRSTRTFIVPHERMKGGGRQKLTDLTDIYLSNQNVGARAVRECIFTVLPTGFTEEAQDLCRKTLEHGEGKPLGERAQGAVNAFAENWGIGQDQLEQKIGRALAKWTPQDVATLQVLFQSIRAGEIRADEEFPPRRVTADELTNEAPAA